ncbi:MAG: 2-hydroxyacyl-CoA dehydratase [Acholeplasmatales bacterium]|nr:2-hydroxyacyl-CoA dehydratase [Acholeplasmatales bacterium]
MGNIYTKKMRKTHTILIPEMMEYHFDLISGAFINAGYKMEVLNYKNPDIEETGLRYCNNDICYPCILIVGQLISSLNHGIYDPNKIAFLIPQTGGACRAGNYYFLIKKALKSAGYENLPVISLNMSGSEKHPGFKLSLKLGFSLISAALYGDLLQSLYFCKRAKEKEEGKALELYNKWNKILSIDISNNKSIKKHAFKRRVREVIDDFNKIETKNIDLPKVGIVGEIYIKSCELGNNNLEDYLKKNNADYFMSGFTSYCMYIADTTVDQFFDKHKLNPFRFINKFVVKWLNKKQKLIYKPLKDNGYVFLSYLELKKFADEVISFKCTTADGWLVSAEVMGLIEAGYNKIIVASPFGCLVSHVCSKGIMRTIMKKYPNSLVYSVEYDSSLSPVGRESRIQLILQS